MISDAGRRLANAMMHSTRGRSGRSLFNVQADLNRMKRKVPNPMGDLPVLDDLLPQGFGGPQGQNLTNITRQVGGANG